LQIATNSKSCVFVVVVRVYQQPSRSNKKQTKVEAEMKKHKTFSFCEFCVCACFKIIKNKKLFFTNDK
jgi:hypothetical protein